MKQRLTVEITPDPNMPNDPKADHVITATFENFNDSTRNDPHFEPWYLPEDIANHFMSKLDQYDAQLAPPVAIDPYQGIPHIASIWQFRIPYSYFEG